MRRRMIMAAVAGAILLVGAYALAQGPGAPGRPGGPGGPGGPAMMHDQMHGQMMHDQMHGQMMHDQMHGPMMYGPMMRGMFSERLDRALDRASVTPEQRVAIYASRDRVFAAMEAQRPDPRSQRDQMLALFEGAQLTQAQLDAVHQQADQQRQAIRAAVDRAILEVHGTLTPAQRKVVVEYFRTHGPGGFGPHGTHGPHGPGGPGGRPAGPGMGGPPAR